MQRDIGLLAFLFKQGLEVDHPVVENLEGVPMEAFGRGLDEFRGHGLEYFLHSPAFGETKNRAASRIGGIGPRCSRAPIQEPTLQSFGILHAKGIKC
jgi:hypothetical protein